jgi:hypothetical protein
MSFCQVMFYMDGYCWDSGDSSNHVSSQNRVLTPSPNTKESRLKNSSLTPLGPFQNGGFEFKMMFYLEVLIVEYFMCILV